jgi:hypothetical protein
MNGADRPASWVDCRAEAFRRFMGFRHHVNLLDSEIKRYFAGRDGFQNIADI